MFAVKLISEFLKHTVNLIVRNKPERFVIDFQKRIHERKPDTISLIRNYFSVLHDGQKLLTGESPGAGSRKQRRPLTISEYAQRTSVSPRRGHLISQVAGYFKPETIIELGTSLGISTMYLASGSPQSRIYTVEGNPQIAEIAGDAFRLHGLNQIKVLNGLFDDMLPDLIQIADSNTMVFIDGNHTYDSTVKYVDAFSKTRVVVIDDIRWSGEMIRAWKEITAAHRNVTIIDLFVMGIIIRGETSRLYHLCL